MNTKPWRLSPNDEGRTLDLARRCGVPEVVARLLLRRGVTHPDAITEFLQCKMTSLRDPSELPGITDAVPIIAAAIKRRDPIVVYGDYDADGMTSAAILVGALRLLDATVSYHVPNRISDGYGLNEDAIRRQHQLGKKVVITVDCGITNVSAAQLCRDLGVQLVITDHHTFADQLPDADAIVHPRLPGHSYPFGDLCGAGVAFKLAWALCQEICGGKIVTDALRQYLLRAMGLAAIGTVADMVPLQGENRILVKHGLRTLLKEPPAGLRNLMQLTKLDQKSQLSAEDISFMLAPRLNAAGRLGQAQLGVELLIIDAGERATQLASYIHDLNKQRETIERRVIAAAKKQIETDYDIESEPAFVIAGVGWHPGVLGLVAGRMADRYQRPVAAISIDASGKPAVGSLRAGNENLNVHAALMECDDLLIRGGGHPAAAGLTIEEKNIDAFRTEFCEAITRQLTDNETLSAIEIDAESTLGQLTLQTLRQIDQMAPFGIGNPRPILCSTAVRLAEPAKRIGGGDRHLTVRFDQDGVQIRGVAFGAGEHCDALNNHDGPLDIVYRPVINEFAGRRSVEMHLIDFRPSTVTQLASKANA